MITQTITRATGIAAAALALLAAACGGGTGAVRTGGGDTTRSEPRRVTTIPGYTEYYRLMRYNALEQIVFCHPTSDPRGEPSIVAVARDLNGRPVKISRYFFGNPDTQQGWTTMQIEYRYFPSTATLVERRTYHDIAGAPIAVGGAHGVEVQYKGGQLTMRRLIDAAGKPLVDVKMVIRSFYREERPGTMIQEWFYGNGRQFRGVGTDEPEHPFGDMPADAYFRRYVVDARGELVREESWDINKTAIPYPGGEIVRAYERNECGQQTSVSYLDTELRPRPNTDGIAQEKFRYDDHGRLVEWQAFGPTGTPQARSSDSAAAAVFRYRAFDGALVGVDRFDAKGDPLP